jgi:hypothetical protein
MTTHKTARRNTPRSAGSDGRSGNTEIFPLPAARSEQTQQNAPIMKPCPALQAPAPTRDLIAERAQAIWLKRGCPRTRDEENWREAEAQLETEWRTLSRSGDSALG